VVEQFSWVRIVFMVGNIVVHHGYYIVRINTIVYEHVPRMAKIRLETKVTGEN
jgi:hypothetical protein